MFHTPDQFHSTEVRNASCAPRGAFYSICPSVTLSLHSPTLKALCFFFFCFFSCTQHSRDGSRWLERWNLKAVHLKSSICICNFFHYFGLFFFLFFFTFNLSPFLYPIYSVYLLTLVESHEVVLLKNQDKCNKQETGVLNVYFYLPSINSPT